MTGTRWEKIDLLHYLFTHEAHSAMVIVGQLKFHMGTSRNWILMVHTLCTSSLPHLVEPEMCWSNWLSLCHAASVLQLLLQVRTTLGSAAYGSLPKFKATPFTARFCLFRQESRAKPAFYCVVSRKVPLDTLTRPVCYHLSVIVDNTVCDDHPTDRFRRL